MKKLIYSLIFIFVFSSCSLFDNKEEKEEINVGNNNSGSIENNGYIDSTVDTSFYSDYLNVELVKDIGLQNVFFTNLESYYMDFIDGELLYYFHALNDNKEFFSANDNDIDFFYIFRNFVFGDNYKVGDDIGLFLKCMNGEIPFTELDGEYRDFCKGSNNYLEESGQDFNYGYEKDLLIKFKELNNGSDLSCDYFIDNEKYNLGEYSMIYSFNNYLVCKKIKEENYPITYVMNIFRESLHSQECLILKDKNLQKFCTYELENNPAYTEEQI